MTRHHTVTWQDLGREPQCPPDDGYPEGIDVVDPTPGEMRCRIDLDYPAPRCGRYIVKCGKCGMIVALTTAGRSDDPRSLTITCRPTVH